jgi:hypothetical protein
VTTETCRVLKNIFNNFSVLNVNIDVCLKRVHGLVLNKINGGLLFTKLFLSLRLVGRIFYFKGEAAINDPTSCR